MPTTVLRSYVLLIAFAFLSSLSRSVAIYVFTWAASQYGHWAISGTLLAGVVPGLVLTLAGGIATDRSNPKFQILLGSLLTGLSLAAIASWHIVSPQLQAMIVGNFAISGVAAFFGVAVFSLPPFLFQKEDLVRVNARLGLANDLAFLAGPLLGARLFARNGVAGTLFAAAMFAILAGLFVAFLPTIKHSVEHRHLDFKFAVAGVRHLAKLKVLHSVLFFFTLSNLLAATFQVVLPPYSMRFGGADSYALLLSAMNFGITISNIALSAFPVRPTQTLIFSTGIVQGMALWGLALGQTQRLAGGFSAIYDGLANTNATLYIAYLQNAVPKDLLGRVLSTANTLAMALAPFGFVVAPVLLGNLGPAAIIFLLGTGTIVAAALGWWYNTMQNRDELGRL